MDLGFGYLAVLESNGSGSTTSVIAHLRTSDAPFQAVIWSVRRREWIYAPARAVRYVYDDGYADRRRLIDRREAESIAQALLGTELPTEAELRNLCGAGATAGQDYGPPRT